MLPTGMPAAFIASSCITSKASPIKHRLDAVFVAKALHAGADHVGEFSDRALGEQRRQRNGARAMPLSFSRVAARSRQDLALSLAGREQDATRSIHWELNERLAAHDAPNLAAIRTAPQTAIKAAQRPKRLGRRAERKEFDRYRNSQAIGFPPGHVSGARPNTGSRSNHW